MKKRGCIFVIALMALASCKAQTIVDIDKYNDANNKGKYFKDINNDFAPFLGTWENTIGNTTFRITFYKTTKMPMGASPVDYYMDMIEANYMLIENEGLPNEIIICQSTQYYPGSIMLAGSTNGITMGGYIYDQCPTGNVTAAISGSIKMEIINPNAGILTANWKITKKAPSLQGVDFSIPTDIILTKQ